MDAAGTQQATDVAKRKIGLGISPVKVSNTIGEVRPNTPPSAGFSKKATKSSPSTTKPCLHMGSVEQIIRENPQPQPETPIHPPRQSIQHHHHPHRRGQNRRVAAKRCRMVQQSPPPLHPSFAEAMQLSWNKTVNYSGMTLSFFGKLLTGNASRWHIFQARLPSPKWQAKPRKLAGSLM